MRAQQRWRTRDQGDSLAVAERLAEIVGLDVYPRHALANVGGVGCYLDGSRTGWAERHRRRLFQRAERSGVPLMVTEGQAEPWEAVESRYDPGRHTYPVIIPVLSRTVHETTVSFSAGTPHPPTANGMAGTPHQSMRCRLQADHTTVRLVAPVHNASHSREVKSLPVVRRLALRPTLMFSSRGTSRTGPSSSADGYKVRAGPACFDIKGAFNPVDVNRAGAEAHTGAVEHLLRAHVQGGLRDTAQRATSYQPLPSQHLIKRREDLASIIDPRYLDAIYQGRKLV